MEKTIVIYKSKRGSTERYAKWIGEELSCPAVKAEEFSKKDFALYDNIIFGGGVQAGGIMGFELIKKNMRRLKEKKLVIFAVGLNVMETESRMQLREINFDKSRLKGLTCYYCPGAYDPKLVTGIDKTIMKMMIRMLEDKGDFNMTENDRRLLKAVKEGCDFSDKKYIAPIVAEFE